MNNQKTTNVNIFEEDLLSGIPLREEVSKANALEYYEDLNAKKKIVSISFPAVKDNTLYKYENGVRVELLSSDFGKNVKAKIGEAYPVVVVKVDRDACVVTVSNTSVTESIRNRIIKAADSAIEESTPFIIKARVVGINKEQGRIIIDVGGAKIPAFIRLANWSHSFIHNIMYCAQRGDIIQVALIKKVKDNYYMYEASRKEALENNLWKGIETRYPVHSNVIVTCVESKPTNWFGKIEGLDDLEVFGELNVVDKNGQKFRIKDGGVYNCYISACSEERRLLKVRPLYRIN